MLAEYPHVELFHVGAAPRRADSTAISESMGHENYDYAEYADTINRVGGVFDLIVVDGRARVACLQAAVGHLAPDGLLVFDNAGRDRYTSGITASGLEVNLRKGMAPTLAWRETTALLRPRAKAETSAS
jgi:predicted O-methyltransferase YrrM